MRLLPLRLLVFCLAAFICEAHAADFKIAAPCEAQMLRAARLYQIPVNVLYAVGLTESARGSRLEPFAINVEGQAYFSSTLAEALHKVRMAQARGAKLIDIGCMQINHHYHGKKFASLELMFDSARNVEYGAKFLVELKAREGSWTKAVARYHAGPGNEPAQRRYICSVIRNMVAVGLGQWTEGAKNFCAAGPLTNR